MTTLRWQTVADVLRREISFGEVGPGGQLDTEAELCRRFATSRITVRRALTELKAEGLVSSQRGSGWRAGRGLGQAAALIVTTGDVAGEPATLTRSDLSWRTQRPTSTLLAVLAQATQDLSNDLTAPWMRLSSLIRAGGTPFDATELWLAPPTVALGIPRHEFAQINTARVLHQHGVRFGAPAQRVRADLASPRDAAHLCCDEGDPILVVERIMHDEAGAVVFVSIHRHQGRRVSLEVDLPTSDRATDRRLGVRTVAGRP